jgi:hypothetical protein
LKTSSEDCFVLTNNQLYQQKFFEQNYQQKKILKNSDLLLPSSSISLSPSKPYWS